MIDNAVTMRRIALAANAASWADCQAQINTRLASPVHLNQLLVPSILAYGQRSMIVNVTWTYS